MKILALAIRLVGEDEDTGPLLSSGYAALLSSTYAALLSSTYAALLSSGYAAKLRTILTTTLYTSELEFYFLSAVN